MESMDIVAQNIEKIGNLFPDCITEVIDDDGNLKKFVDFDKLKQNFYKDIKDIKDDKTEHYEFTWVGKKVAKIEANKPINKTLRPCIEESKNWDNTENLYIEGDNFEVLKLLQKSYFNKVKVIYIDPPYNTGNDFIYVDDFSQLKKDYEKTKGTFDENGNRLFKNTDTNGRFHSDWCSMIYPRLILARNLLADDGIIIISIDDSEQANLKKICDEVLGEENLVNIVSVKMSEASGVKMKHIDKRLPKLKEYLFIYQKKECKINSIKIKKGEWDKEYKHIIENISDDELKILKDFLYNTTSNIIPKNIVEIVDKLDYKNLSEIYKNKGLKTKEEKINYNYDNAERIFQACSLPVKTYEVLNKLVKNKKNKFIIFKTAKGLFYLIKGDYDLEQKKPRAQVVFASEYLDINVGDFWYDIKTTGINAEGKVNFKNGKKPIKLIKRILSLIKEDNILVLDFFSGSATTAHAVMQLNAEDGGKRKFIMVQWPEKIDEKNIEFKNICELGKQRIRNAGEKIKEEAGLNGQNLDIGFRVLKLDSSNMKDIYYSADEYDQGMLENMQSNTKEDRTDLDLLFGCLVDWGLELDKLYTTKVINGHKVHIYNDGDLVACFEKNLDMKTIDEIAKLQALRVVFCDNSFVDSATKINVAEHFKMIAPDTDIKVI